MTSTQPRRPPGEQSRAALERAARLSRLTGASLIGLAITAFWTLRLLGVL